MRLKAEPPEAPNPVHALPYGGGFLDTVALK